MRTREKLNVQAPPLKPEHMPGLHVEDVAYKILPADRRHHRYICDAMGKTLPQHDQTLSHESAFLQTLVLVTARDWFTVVAVPEGDEHDVRPEILGFALYRAANTIAWVQVKSRYRGRGIGAALLGFPIHDVGWDKCSGTPFRSAEGWVWAMRRGVKAVHQPNMIYRYMDKLCKSLVIEELKARLE